MSRCYPFPPPGYVRKEASGDALIESIKLQREREDKAKTERKKEKKEKREKRKEEKKKEDKAVLAASDKHRCLSNVSSIQGEKSLVNSSCQNLQKCRENEDEQLEKSGLSEEHEPPVFWKSSSHSTDSIENRNKRKRQTAFTEDHGHGGNVIRIRLPTQKDQGSVELHQNDVSGYNKVLERHSSCKESHVEPQHPNKVFLAQPQPQPHRKASLAKPQPPSKPSLAQPQPPSKPSLAKSQPPSKPPSLAKPEPPSKPSLARPQPQSKPSHTRPQPPSKPSPALHKNDIVPAPIQGRLCTELPSTSGRVEVPAIIESRCKSPKVPARHKKIHKKMRKAEKKYRNLIEDWVPPSLEIENTGDGDGDEGWLLDTKYPGRSVLEMCKSNWEITCDPCTAMLPHAHCIPEVDMYALPFTVPF